MRVKRLMIAVVLICFALGSTGCGEKLYTMTEEEEEIITLYSAKMVSKFNKNQTTGVCNARVKPGELDGVDGITTEEPVPEPSQIIAEDGSILLEDGNFATVDGSNAEATDGGYSLTETIGIAGMEFALDSLNVMKEYKASDYFVLTAGAGKRYLVLNIVGKNITQSAIELDMSVVRDVTYRLRVNDSASAVSQKTVLLEDLSSFFGTISSGEEKRFVLIFQFDESQVENISKVLLEVTSGGSTRGTTF